MSKLSEFAVKVLKQYAEETTALPRSTSDISPFEEWLIIKLFDNEIEEKVIIVTCPVCNGEGEFQVSDTDYDSCRRCNGSGKIKTTK